MAPSRNVPSNFINAWTPATIEIVFAVHLCITYNTMSLKLKVGALQLISFATEIRFSQYHRWPFVRRRYNPLRSWDDVIINDLFTNISSRSKYAQTKSCTHACGTAARRVCLLYVRTEDDPFRSTHTPWRVLGFCPGNLWANTTANHVTEKDTHATIVYYLYTRISGPIAKEAIRSFRPWFCNSSRKVLRSGTAHRVP